MREPQDYGALATGLADMARQLLAQESVQETLDSIVAHAVRLVDGCEAAGILQIRNGDVFTLAGTDPVARVSDRIEAQLREGPCFDAAIRDERVYRIEDIAEPGSRWPEYAKQVGELGVGSVMGFLLYTNDESNLGALDLYSSQRGAFGEQSEHVGWVLASHAAVALSGARHSENMDHALGTSRMIGEAIGVVMSSYKLTEHAAFETIRRISQTKNIKVRDLAETITSSGLLPGEHD